MRRSNDIGVMVPRARHASRFHHERIGYRRRWALRIAAGSDSVSHLSQEILRYLEEKGIETVRCGALAGKTSDYVDAAQEVADLVASGACEQGLLFCNTGTGVSIVANKVPGVRAALCQDAYAARIARLANNANVLVLSIRLTGEPLAKEIVDAWLETSPSSEPRRVHFHRKTEQIDQQYRRSERDPAAFKGGGACGQADAPKE